MPAPVDRVVMEWSGSVARRVAGAAVAVAGVLLIVAGVAIWAQNSGRDVAEENAYQFEGYSLSMHLLAMSAVVVFTVGTAAVLWGRARKTLAVLVVLGTAGGPMWVTAAPVRPGLVRSFDDTVLWWHAVVQVPQAVLILVASLLLARLSPERTAAVLVPARAKGPSDTAWFAVVAAVALTVQVLARSGNDGQPGPPMIGWALVVAGASVLVRRSSPVWGPGVVLTGTAVVVSALHLAYDRDGGWPGAAGWETFAQSPIVQSWVTIGVLLALPASAVLLQLRQRVLMATAITPAASPP